MGILPDSTGYFYDSRIARWLTVDPAGQYASPYVAMGADPVNGVDLDGGTVLPVRFMICLRLQYMPVKAIMI